MPLQSAYREAEAEASAVVPQPGATPPRLGKVGAADLILIITSVPGRLNWPKDRGVTPARHDVSQPPPHPEVE